MKKYAFVLGACILLAWMGNFQNLKGYCSGISLMVLENVEALAADESGYSFDCQGDKKMGTCAVHCVNCGKLVERRERECGPAKNLSGKCPHCGQGL